MGQTSVVRIGNQICYQVYQVNHGFGFMEIIRRDRTLQAYVLAQANTKENAEVCGMVVRVIDANNFIYQQVGMLYNIVNPPVPLVDGEVYFLSASNPGQMTIVEPTALTNISKPVFLCTGTDSGQIYHMRGFYVGFPNVDEDDESDNGYELGSLGALLHARDQKFVGESGGTFTSGAWRTREVNLVVTNNIEASLAGNQITLKAGTYFAEIYCPVGRNSGATDPDGHKARLYDITGATNLLIGQSGANSENVWKQYTSTIQGMFTLAVDSVLEVQHQITNTCSDRGFGVESNLDSMPEIYANVIIHKLTAGGTGGPDGNLGEVLHVRDEKAAGTDGGTFTTGSWQTRTINTVKTNNVAGSSLAANQITLAAGNYWVDIYVPAAGESIDGPQPGGHKAKLRDVTNNVDLLIGVSGHIDRDDAKQYDSHIRGFFTLAGAADLEVWHRSSGATATGEGFGQASNIGGLVEVYVEALVYDVKTAITGSVLGYGSLGDVFHVRDVKAVGTDGGTFTGGSWQTRTLNTIETNNIGGALAANVVTLTPGIYYADIYVPICWDGVTAFTGTHRARLRNVTNNVTILMSYSGAISEFAYKQYNARLQGTFTVTANTDFEVQHLTTATLLTKGFGAASNVDGLDEIYVDALFYKIGEV
jgi:hypothetical protein